MKTPLLRLLIACLSVGLLIFSVLQGFAQEARFFRIQGPGTTRIISVSADGMITWTNAGTGSNCIIQTTTDLGQSNWTDCVQVPVNNNVVTVRVFDPAPPEGMVLIPAGSFTMGNCMDPNEGDSGELPLHSVYLRAFYMDQYDVTKPLWDSVYQWATNHGYSFYAIASGKATNQPVQNVYWHACILWCNARSEKEARVPAYYTSPSLATVYRSGFLDLSNSCVNWSASGYRLPTEAEWEKAARGGVGGHRFPWSSADTISENQANYYSTGISHYSYDLSNTGYNPAWNDGVFPYTNPVGHYAPNGYGLYDMAGNVWQWCWDWYGAYSSAAQSDPHGPESGGDRVNRGGCWDDRCQAVGCRTAFRNVNSPLSHYDGLGFRCVKGF